MPYARLGSAVKALEKVKVKVGVTLLPVRVAITA
jgi:hypothetical protein